MPNVRTLLAPLLLLVGLLTTLTNVTAQVGPTGAIVGDYEVLNAAGDPLGLVYIEPGAFPGTYIGTVTTLGGEIIESEELNIAVCGPFYHWETLTGSGVFEWDANANMWKSTVDTGPNAGVVRFLDRLPE